MARRMKEVNYTGKALKIFEKVQRLEAELKEAKAELKIAYKEQIKEEKEAAARVKKENQEKLLKAIEESGKSIDEILELLNKNTQ